MEHYKHFNEMNQEERDRALLEITTPGSYQDDKQTQQQNENFIMNKIKCRKLLDDSEEFNGSDAEFLFIENEIAKEEEQIIPHWNSDIVDPKET